MAKKNKEKRKFHPERSAQRLITGEDLGQESERKSTGREGAEHYGFGKLPSTVIDTLSDLNSKTHRELETVDSIAGDDAVGDASELSDFDTITDSNTLTSAAIISGAFLTGDPFQSRLEEETEMEHYDETHEEDFMLVIDEEGAELSEEEEEPLSTVSDIDLHSRRIEKSRLTPSSTQEATLLKAGLEVDSIQHTQESNLGLRDAPDKETTRRYVVDKKAKRPEKNRTLD